MENRIKLDFCEIVFSSEDSYIEHEKRLIEESYKFNKDFFRIEIPFFEIKIVYSREEFNKIWDSDTPNYVSAFAKDDNIVIFSYSVFDKETKWKKEKFKEALIHEINHLFYQELRDDEYDPLWLSEGLATFMQHGRKKHEYKKKLKITKQVLNQKFEEITLNIYQVFTLFAEYLILKFGEDKILELIKNLKEGKELNDSFREIYNKDFDELIEDANRYHKIA
ncbi:MAG: hypothetical protein ABIE36_02960 [Candidatus Diapherotrites archaeon]